MSENLARQFLIREDVVFLNHGSFGACPRPVFAAYQNWQLELERQPVEFLGRNLTETMRQPRIALAAELGTVPENIVGLTNATLGLNIVAQSLDLKPGDQILTTDHEYSALEKTWAYVARRTGAEIVVVKIPMPLTTEAQFTDTVIAGMTDRTRVLFLSHITSPTALLFPIDRSIAEARKRGIWSVIDGAHTPGHIKLELDALGADFYSGNCHKWMMAPKGSAFLHARPEVQGLINPLVISHGWTANSKEPGAKGAFGNSPFIDELEMQGTRDPAPWLTVPAALAYRRDNDWPSVQAHCHALAQDTARRLGELTGLAPLSAPEFCAPQMVAMPVPDCDVDAIKDALLDKYSIEIPVFRWQDTCIVRLSVQGYNSKPQMDLLLTALTDLLHLEGAAERRVS
ncbi:MAG: aminotransferase class V-fold PLP-dependent enzyme [Alphaproteobacteria bacterium]|nr:aminotransferase class V-fold PLP-dependent enzyme [Alphaproteobacteria bacterium]MBU1559971.1 aminotransferase class V-fold PLP-dependent enzyme [Alphaproteobacteria bacterium]MBU2302273.1 aminotransferase class V-fold PLP-dependent enzyme [Alphaproteobacteria bacterium]MBU2369453.1 aminotransferase class V-fold PLP-dependent enzyme [Alphaproteobacteria bacterium]